MTAQTYSQFSRTFIKWKVFELRIKRFSVYALRAPMSYLHCLEKWRAEEKEARLKFKMSACHCNYSSEDEAKGLTG